MAEVRREKLSAATWRVGYEGLYEVSDTGVIYPVRTQPPPPTGYLYIAGKVRHLALLCNKNDRLDIVDVGSLF